MKTIINRVALASLLMLLLVSCDDDAKIGQFVKVEKTKYLGDTGNYPRTIITTVAEKYKPYDAWVNTIIYEDTIKLKIDSIKTAEFKKAVNFINN